MLSNLYLNEVDRMLERAREVTRNGRYTYIDYARFADDLVILIDAYKRHDWLVAAVDKRLREEFGKLQVEINDEKSRTVDLERGESSWASTSVTSAADAGRCGRITRPSSKSGRR